MFDLHDLMEELASDPTFRRAFAQSPAAVLRARGYDLSAFSVPHQIDLRQLEQQLQVWQAQRDHSPAVVTDPGGGGTRRLRHQLGAPQPGASRLPARKPSLIDATLALPPFTAPARSGQPRTGVQTEAAALRDPASSGLSSASESATTGLPSAWYGSFGTVVSRVLAGRSDASVMMPESIIGSDDRVQITDTAAEPFVWLYRLVIEAANGTWWSGTGWSMAPGLIVTAGHCVFMKNQGGWVRSIRVHGMGPGGREGSPVIADSVASVAGWVQDGDPEQDYGVIGLARGTPSPGWMGFGSFEDASLQGVIANIAGFPVDRPVGTLWGHARAIADVRERLMVYDIDTYGGMSGAPVICWNGQDFIAVGIHNYGDLAGNQCTRINQEVFENLKAWIEEYA